MENPRQRAARIAGEELLRRMAEQHKFPTKETTPNLVRQQAREAQAKLQARRKERSEIKRIDIFGMP